MKKLNKIQKALESTVYHTVLLAFVAFLMHSVSCVEYLNYLPEMGVHNI